MTTRPADELRQAADRLRALAAAVDQDIVENPYWGSSGHPPHTYTTVYARGVDGGLGGPAGAFAAAMHPGVGTALADWLESWTGIDLYEAGSLPEDAKHALAVARQINAASA